MPYLAKMDRNRIDSGERPTTPGELNYALIRMALTYVARKGLSYRVINDVLGAFSGASQEFYRRVAAEYEQQKCIENGDVFA